MDHPTVSVIMSVYNERPTWLRQSVESILGQTLRDLEFIVILDDPCNTVLEDILLEYAEKDERIVFLKNDRNRGLVFSLNRALETARGQYIARMDADDISEPYRLELELRTLNAEGLDLVAGTVRLMDEEGAPTRDPDEPIPLPGTVPETWRRLLCIDNIAAHPTWFVRAETYRRVGPYHDIPRAEDCEWLCRAAVMGMRMRNLDDCLLRYRIRGGSVSTGGAYAQLLVADAVRREYRRALRRGRSFDEAALRRDIDRLDLTQDGARHRQAREDYFAAWETLHRRRIPGIAALLGVFLRYPPVLRIPLDNMRIRRIERSARSHHTAMEGGRNNA